MKPATPLTTGRKWLYRVLGAVLVLGSVASIPRLIPVVTKAKEMWSAKGGVSNQQLNEALAFAAGNVVGVAGLLAIGIWLLIRSWKKTGPAAASPAEASPASAPAPARTAASRKRAAKRGGSCLVLQTAAEGRSLWQFAVGGNQPVLQREEAKPAAAPLPEKLVAKDWQTLFQPRLNVAWLPANQVFLRALQIPKADDPAETQSMIELQLEKVSPLPVAQIVWSYELISHPLGEMQTAIIIVVPRHAVEEFLGQLEAQKYFTDRLELPLVDELAAIKAGQEKRWTDGVWIFPGAGGNPNACLVAWWYGGILQNVGLLTLPPNEARGVLLQNQLTQMIWAGELEGWLTQPPRFHLVAEGALAAAWQTVFTPEQPVEIVPPLAPRELAARTAGRVAADSQHTNLLPPDYTARYQQQFVDGLWMSGLGALLMVYLAGVLVYFGLVQWANWRLGGVEDQMAQLGPDYTNTLQLKERVKVLQDQVDLQFAALDCYKAVADFLPDTLTLDALLFDRRKLTLQGTANSDDIGKIHDFNEKLRSAMDRNQKQPLFSRVNPPNINPRPGGQQSTWTFNCELKRAEGE